MGKFGVVEFDNLLLIEDGKVFHEQAQ